MLRAEVSDTADNCKAEHADHDRRQQGNQQPMGLGPGQVPLQGGRQGIDHGKHKQSGQQNRQEMQVQNGQQGECGEHLADLAESCGIESCGKRHRTGGFLSVAQSVSRRGAMPVRAVISMQ